MTITARSSDRPGPFARWGKRCLDVAVSAGALAVFAPVIAVVAAAVRVKMGAPVLFRQPRPGLGEQTFTILKFRTMSDACDAAGRPLPDAARLTRLGVLLRKTSLDELPQLVNVLRGEMSLVGPRPLSVRYLPYYSTREQTRHDVRPGITGLAQVSGRNEIEWDARLELDATYVETVSLLGDLRILARTVARVAGSRDVRVDTTSMVSLHEERAHRRRAA
ncbi:MAG: sugar transferase [Deltaproteobacteria bacterium]|nr:sugar transferase [Nannocystaceae bacterium]